MTEIRGIRMFQDENGERRLILAIRTQSGMRKVARKKAKGEKFRDVLPALQAMLPE